MAKNKKQAPGERNQNLELENQLKRALADYQNLERRVSEERKILSELSSALVIEKFLPVVDNLTVAQSHLNDQGLAMVIKQLQDILQSEGVTEFAVVGEQFNPNLHEAAEVTVGQNDNTVVKVLAKGYKIRDRVIRPARVVVSKKSEASLQDSQNEKGDVVENGSSDEPLTIND